MRNVVDLDTSSIPKNKSPLIKSQEISYIGRCLGCGEMDVLIDGACTGCVDLYGEKCGAMFQKIRQDPKFARLCYEKLRHEESKKQFIEFFGSQILDVATSGVI